jgi:hypothetical protein
MRLTRIQVAARSGTLALTLMLALTLGAAVVEVMVAIRRAACKYTPSLTATMHCTCIIIIKPQA